MATLPKMDMKAHLLRLPPELTLAMVNLVDPSDINSLRLTHSVLYDACLTKRKPTATFQQTSARLSLFFADILSRAESDKPVLRAILSQLESVTITYVHCISSARMCIDEDWDQVDTHPLTRCCPRLLGRFLRVLRVLGSQDMCPHLKYLQLDIGHIFSFGDDNNRLDNIPFPMLKALELRSFVYLPAGFLSNCPSLEYLRIDSGLFRDLGKSKLPSVTTLRISSPLRSELEFFLVKLPLLLPNLEVLGIDELMYPTRKTPNSEKYEPILEIKKAIVKMPTLRTIVLTIQSLAFPAVNVSVDGPYGALCAAILKESSTLQLVVVRVEYPIVYKAERAEGSIRSTKVSVSSTTWPFRQY